MNDALSTATTAVQVTQTDADADLCLGAEFRYDPADPWAVTMVIESISGPVRWTFARELILSGLFEPTGVGDVHIWPCLNTDGAAVVIVELQAPAGVTLLQFPSRAVHQFVSASLAAVPEGTEQHDVDAWLALLLADTDPARH
jgi:hypothetical protein